MSETLAILNREVSARTLSDLTEFYTDAEQAAIDAEAEAERVADEAFRADWRSMQLGRGDWLADQIATLRSAHTIVEIEVRHVARLAGRAARRLDRHPVATDGSTPDPEGRAILERRLRAAQNRLDVAYTRRAIILEQSDRIGADVTGKARKAAIQALRVKLAL